MRIHSLIYFRLWKYTQRHMNTGTVRMLYFLAFATSESDSFIPSALCFKCCSLPFTSQATLSVFYVVLHGFVSNSLLCFYWWVLLICTHAADNSMAPFRTLVPFRWDTAAMSRCITEVTQLVPDLCILQWKQRPDESELKLLLHRTLLGLFVSLTMSTGVGYTPIYCFE